ncbi:DNA-binding GntR family transcriptional regulator [Kineococcus radiotolerans]|uniref:DNA-binding GntR family transcriptional regulator n=1 Tax=Kineococcus radiotolerans TaxID=131568 RepID=A0A7W4XVU9_KINRA|nr:GntR family transcriptional regulator [Kineococcus radiotolerans]MBB2899475.1 DNA-binding GntR family transcriptional regulator [Kineococcus radiotolerans]
MDSSPATTTTRAGEGDWSVSAPRGLSDTVHDAILELLMNRGLEPGSALRTQTLAVRLGVSATPVREALARLEGSGLVVRSARRGYRAAPLLSPEELAQLVDVRLLVEPGNAERACARSDDAFVARLWSAVEDQRTAPTGPGYAGFKHYLEADWSFHELVAQGTGNPFIVRTLDSFRGFVQRLHQVEERVSDADESVSEHEAIVRAFEQRDPAAAAAAMRAHLRGVLDRAVG